MFASYLSRRGETWRAAPLTATLLIAALILLPLGFFLGGLTPTSTDPGVGIWLVPLGGLSLLSACVAAGSARD